MDIFQKFKCGFQISSFSAWRFFMPKLGLSNGRFLTKGKSVISSVKNISVRKELFFQKFFREKILFGAKNRSRKSYQLIFTSADVTSARRKKWISLASTRRLHRFPQPTEHSLQCFEAPKLAVSKWNSKILDGGCSFLFEVLWRKPASASESALKTASLPPPK